LQPENVAEVLKKQILLIREQKGHYTDIMSAQNDANQARLEKDRAYRREHLARKEASAKQWASLKQQPSWFLSANANEVSALLQKHVAPHMPALVTVPVTTTAPAPMPATVAVPTVAVPGAALQAAPETAPVASVLAPHVAQSMLAPHVEVSTRVLKRVRVKKTPLSPEARKMKLERRAILSLKRKEDNKQRKRRKVPETIEMTGVDLLLHAASRLGTGKQQCTVDHESSDSEEEVGKLVMDLSDDEM
jgi:hypothetical protein